MESPSRGVPGAGAALEKIITPISSGTAMAKSLGQIHTANYTFSKSGTPGLGGDDGFLVDLPGVLSDQLQHMVRMMSTFKVVGIDMSIGSNVNQADLTASATGRLLYYAPTQGRVEALQKAYASLRRMMTLKGIKPSNNVNYDFRPCIVDPAHAGAGAIPVIENGDEFLNQATLEDNGLATCLANGPAGSSNIFGIYNQGIQPRLTSGAATFFEDGFNIGLRSNADSDDFVLNQKVIIESTVPTASEELESIPWEVSYTSSAGATGVTTADEFNWRPDPALYLSVLTGQFICAIDSIDATNSAGEDKTGFVDLD